MNGHGMIVLGVGTRAIQILARINQIANNGRVISDLEKMIITAETPGTLNLTQKDQSAGDDIGTIRNGTTIVTRTRAQTQRNIIPLNLVVNDRMSFSPLKCPPPKWPPGRLLHPGNRHQSFLRVRFQGYGLSKLAWSRRTFSTRNSRWSLK